MANKQAWQDFEEITKKIEQIESQVKSVGVYCLELKALKKNILDDSERKAEVGKIIDEHHDYTITSLSDKYVKSKVLYDWLNSNGYLDD